MTSDDFAVEDYKLALAYLQAHFERLWKRFNFFLTVQVALFGGYGWTINHQHSPAAIYLLSALGIFLSTLWYMVAAEDLFLVQSYRDRVMKAAETIATFSNLNNKYVEMPYIGADVKTCFSSPISWYYRPLSITRLPVWISMVLVVAWVVLLSKGESWSYVPLGVTK